MNNGMSFHTLLQSRSLRRVLFIAAGCITVGLFLRVSFWGEEPDTIPAAVTPESRFAKALVVSSQVKDDTSWLQEHLSNWDIIRYVVDDPAAQFRVPMNKGREAMVYLTYMIDNYDNLPDLMVFIHGERYQWHNDDPIYDGVQMLQNLQLPYLVSQGYANIRCVWTLGCPNELRGLDQPIHGDPKDEKSAENTQLNYPKAFQELFPGTPLPPTVGVGCCAQFALTREKIHERPVEDFVHYRQWLLDTPLADHVSGRILEYSWHMIFGKSAVHCPNAKECYCRTFGLCNLECEESKCGERWPYPPFATLPKGWPTIGWEGETRDQEFIASLRNVAVANQTTT